jgi:FolB domain-containing protein
MDKIRIVDLEVFYHVGVTDQERAQPQRLLVSVEVEHDFKHAVAADNLADTIDYFAVCQRLLAFGEGCQWQLIETLSADIATMVLDEFRARAVTVEVKKFVIPEAAYVSVVVQRNHP